MQSINDVNSIARHGFEKACWSSRFITKSGSNQSRPWERARDLIPNMYCERDEGKGVNNWRWTRTKGVIYVGRGASPWPPWRVWRMVSQLWGREGAELFRWRTGSGRVIHNSLEPWLSAGRRLWVCLDSIESFPFFFFLLSVYVPNANRLFFPIHARTPLYIAIILLILPSEARNYYFLHK